jgi:hypothetical protein
MPLVSPSGLRRIEFEAMEPRLMLAADAPSPVFMPGAAVDDIVMQLPGSISGSVFVATHAEEPRQAGNTGISGVRVELLSAAGEVLAEALTDEAGEYEFPALAPGTYAVRQIQPAGWLDGYELAGPGGAFSPEPNLIGQIVVQPGAMLTGYDFAEFATSVQPAEYRGDGSSLLGFLPPLTVSWSRPAETLAPPSSEPSAPRPLQPPLPERRPEEPIFGGSSRVLNEQDAAIEAFTSEDEAKEKVARRPDRKREDYGDELTSVNTARLAVRDLAFESDDAAAEDKEAGESAAEDSVSQPSGGAAVARRQLPPDKTVKKPAA